MSSILLSMIELKREEDKSTTFDGWNLFLCSFSSNMSISSIFPLHCSSSHRAILVSSEIVLGNDCLLYLHFGEKSFILKAFFFKWVVEVQLTPFTNFVPITRKFWTISFPCEICHRTVHLVYILPFITFFVYFGLTLRSPTTNPERVAQSCRFDYLNLNFTKIRPSPFHLFGRTKEHSKHQDYDIFMFTTLDFQNQVRDSFELMWYVTLSARNVNSEPWNHEAG